MATEIERERLRGDLGADDDALTDAEIDDAFARATDKYGDHQDAVEAAARVLTIQQLLADAAKRADATQNQSSERHSQVFDHLMQIRAIYEADLQTALDTSVQIGQRSRRARRFEEYPDDA
jgi:hypothetical protein